MILITSPRTCIQAAGWAAASDVELVFLPAYSSWLNWIHEFAALRYFPLNGTDHRTHAEQDDAIATYMRWRNACAKPKRDFAPNQSLGTWTSYQNKVA